MSISPPAGPTDPRTPIYDQTVTATAVHVDETPAQGSAPASGADKAGQAAGAAKDTAKQAAGQAADEAKQVGSTAKDAGQRVVSTTKDEASRVASDAVGQAKQLYGQATDQLSEQASKQQKNAAAALKTFGEDLSSMHASADGGGLAAELVQTVSQRAGRVSEWLERREPGEVLDEVKQFAARRPGLFIGLALVTGVVAARAAKALVAEAKPDEAPTAAAPDPTPTTFRSSHEPAAPVREAPITDPYGDVGLPGAGWSSTDAPRGSGDAR